MLLRALRRVLTSDVEAQDQTLTQADVRAKVEAQMVQDVRPRGRKRWRFQPYVLRHTCFTELRKRGADLADVQALAGHKNIQTTKRYSPTVKTPSSWRR